MVDFPSGVTATNPTSLLGSNGTDPAKAILSSISLSILSATTAAAIQTILGVAAANAVVDQVLTRTPVVNIDMANRWQWNIASMPADSFPLLGVFKIVNNSTHTPTAGDHCVSLISLAEDEVGCSFNLIAGEGRVNAKGTAQYVGYNSKFTYRSAGQFPSENGFTSAAHWADVLITGLDGVTPLTSPGLFSTCYLATAIVGGDPLLRATLRGYDRIITYSATNASATDAAIHVPNGGITCGGSAWFGGNLTIGGTATASMSLNNFYGGFTSQNLNAGTVAAACVALISNAGACYVGKASAAHAVVPNAAGAFFVYDTTGIRLAGSATTVDSLKVGADQVVGARQAAIADATDAASAITRVNLVLAAMRAHGSIAS
jgi:hypothetical protein